MSDQSQIPDWARLFRIARSLIKQTNAPYPAIDRWTFGGGTAMMLQIDHRESNDVDLFLDDAQLLPFLDPKNHDFTYEIVPSDYGGDGATFLKLAFEGIGQIDFIVSQALTNRPAEERVVEGESTLLETIPEIIAKKIVHRGTSIKARDIFDIAAGARDNADSIVAALRAYPAAVKATLKQVNELNPDFLNRAIQALMIRDSFRDLSRSAIERTRKVLTAAL